MQTRFFGPSTDSFTYESSDVEETIVEPGEDGRVRVTLIFALGKEPLWQPQRTAPDPILGMGRET